MSAASSFERPAMPGEARPHADAAARLRAAGLACRRGDRLLFMSLDLTLHAGELVWLRGANGSGKTSLLKILAGLATPEAGRVEHVAGPAAGRDDGAADTERPLLYLAHANALKDDLTASESLAFLLRMNGIASTPSTRLDALSQVGIADRRDALVRTLSQGQRKRVSLARLALASPTGVWLLDEPFDALDAAGIAWLEAMLAEHVASGGSAIVTSHRPLGDALLAPTVWQLGAA